MRIKLSYKAPRALLAEARDEMVSIKNSQLFNSAKYEKTLEKWCAGMFGIGYEKCSAPCQVTVNTGHERLDADIFMETAGQTYAFQLVEVMEPGRLRGKEYKDSEHGSGRGFSDYELEQGRIEGPRWIAEKIALKAQKNYEKSEELNLLVYQNFSARQISHEEVSEASRPYSSKFASIWVVSSTCLGSLSVLNDLVPINGWCQLNELDNLYNS